MNLNEHTFYYTLRLRRRGEVKVNQITSSLKMLSRTFWLVFATEIRQHLFSLKKIMFSFYHLYFDSYQVISFRTFASWIQFYNYSKTWSLQANKWPLYKLGLRSCFCYAGRLIATLVIKKLYLALQEKEIHRVNMRI